MKLLIASVVICALAGAASGDSARRADQLFKNGKRLLAQKKYAEACRAFEDSDRIDPGIGAKLNAAKCYQEWGKLATAWRWFVDAETMATSARDPRAKKIHELVEAIEPSVPRLTVKAPPGADLAGVLIKLDGVALEPSGLGVEQRVDPGPHEVETTIAGVRQVKVVAVERGGVTEALLDIPAASRTRDSPARTSRTRAPTGPPPDSVPTGEPARDPARTRRLVGLGVAGAGVVAMGIAGLVTLGARGDYRDALAAHCQGATDMCDEQGLEITHSAAHRANIATVVTLGGLAAVAGGLIAYFTAPRAPRAGEHALYLAPSVGAGGGAFVLGGAF
jgi:hypothetical protein